MLLTPKGHQGLKTSRYYIVGKNSLFRRLLKGKYLLITNNEGFEQPQPKICPAHLSNPIRKAIQLMSARYRS
jgi:hypothetical protein